MTVTNDTNKIKYDGDDATVAFDFDFKIFSSDDLFVYLIDSDGVSTLQTISVDYTLTIDDPEGGTVTMGTAPASDEELLIVRTLDLTQPTDLPTETNFPEITIENEFDRSRMIDIQLLEQIDRALKLPISSETGDLALPEPESNKVLTWNDAGDALENRAIDGIASLYGSDLITAVNAAAARTVLELGSAAVEDISAFGITLIDDVDAATARATLGLGSAALEDVGQATDEINTNGAALTSNRRVVTDASSKFITEDEYNTLYVDAGGMIPDDVNNPEEKTIQIDSGTNNVNVDVIAFDKAIDEQAHFKFKVPEDWDGGSDWKIKLYWNLSSAEGVARITVFNLETIDVENSENIGTASTNWVQRAVISDSCDTTNKNFIAVATLDYDAGGLNITPGNMIYFRLTRDADNAADVIDQDVNVLGIAFQYKKKTGVTQWS
jgi:hypothetical protein